MEGNNRESKLEDLASDIRLSVLRKLWSAKVSLIEKTNLFPEMGIQVKFQDPNIGEVTVSVFFNLEGDKNDEFVITAMTTLPNNEKVKATSLGYGGKVIDAMMAMLSKRKDISSIMAAQVQSNFANKIKPESQSSTPSKSERFWTKSGFMKISSADPTNMWKYIGKRVRGANGFRA